MQPLATVRGRHGDASERRQIGCGIASGDGNLSGDDA
jgi:hypothetical protein